MKKQVIVRLWVLLVTTLMSATVMAQAVIKYKFQDNIYSFQLNGKQWGTISGLSFDVRQSFGSLLGEPVTNNNVRYWFERGPFEPSISLFRDVSSAPFAESPTPDGQHWATISFIDGDSISVKTTTGGLFQVSYPYERFIEQVRVVSAHFVGRYQFFGRNESIEMVGGFDGVFGAPGNWGWNFPGSPSWNRALVSNYNYVVRGTKPIAWYSKSKARDLFATLIEACQPACDGSVLSLQDLNLNIHGVLNDIAAQSEEFRMTYYNRDSRATMLSSLMSAAQSEPDPKLRKRRQALANRALKAFGNEQSQTFKQQWGFTADRNKQSTTEQAMASIDEGFCQMMTEGKVQEGTLGRLKKLVKQEGSLPRQLQNRADESLKLLSKKGLGAGDIQVTLTWDDRKDWASPYFEVELPNSKNRISSDSDATHKHQFTRWTMSEAPAGKYWVSIYSQGPWGYSFNYQLRIEGGGKVDVHKGRIRLPTQGVGHDFSFASNKVGEGRGCQNLTEL